MPLMGSSVNAPANHAYRRSSAFARRRVAIRHPDGDSASGYSAQWSRARLKQRQWLVDRGRHHGAYGGQDVRRARCVEPDDKKPFVKVPYDEGVQQAVHVNHDRHFTSHYNIYSTMPWAEAIVGWGDFRQYFPERLLK